MKELGCICLPQCLLMDSSTLGSVVEEGKLMSMFLLAKMKMVLLTMWCILSYWSECDYYTLSIHFPVDVPIDNIDLFLNAV